MNKQQSKMWQERNFLMSQVARMRRERGNFEPIQGEENNLVNLRKEYEELANIEDLHSATY